MRPAEIGRSTQQKGTDKMARNCIAAGALFRDAPISDGKTRPVMHVSLDVCGVKLTLAVWPKETGKSGTAYWPVTGEYARGEARRLVDVTPTVGAAAQGGQAEPPAAPASALGAAPAAEDLPF